LLRALDDVSFVLAHIGPYPGCYDGPPRYAMPDNVVRMVESYCQERADLFDRPRGPIPRAQRRRSRQRSRIHRAIVHIHTREDVNDDLVADLAASDLSLSDFLYGDASFALLSEELYDHLTPDLPFSEFFWQFRAMHVPMMRMLRADVPEAGVYHSVSTGYAGLMGVVAAERSGRPFVVTEHGLYAREREMELARASWISDGDGPAALGEVEISPLRTMWSHFFFMLSRIAYHRADELLTLSEVNRRKQIDDGADDAKIKVVPNGVDVDSYAPLVRAREEDDEDRAMRVGFVGRVVPIKDVLTLIRGCARALHEVDLEVWIVGPQDEDADYAERCHALVESLGLGKHIQFLGPQPMREIYPQLDLVLLTSISEGQPLVILEAYAAAIPVVASDVGACRELIEGRDAEDAALGHAGIVTGVARPAQTAAALVELARDPQLREHMGRVGLERVTRFYQQRDVIATYGTLYRKMVSS
jgi:glycosyltransferase involved in cell wall biosynthesis